MSGFLGGAASYIYSQSESGSSSTQSFIPRSKFQFKVEIDYHGGSGNIQTLKLERISEVQMPGVIFKTTLMNQYNKKRLANTGIDYTPIYINAYDTRDAEIEKFLKEYSAYYYDGPMNDTFGRAQLTDDIVQDGFIYGQSQRGLKLRDSRFYIQKIRITRISSSEDTNLITIFNPLITAVQGDTLSYSDSNPVQYRIEFAYEGYDIRTL